MKKSLPSSSRDRTKEVLPSAEGGALFDILSSFEKRGHSIRRMPCLRSTLQQFLNCRRAAGNIENVTTSHQKVFPTSAEILENIRENANETELHS